MYFLFRHTQKNNNKKYISIKNTVNTLYQQNAIEWGYTWLLETIKLFSNSWGIIKSATSNKIIRTNYHYESSD